MKNKITIIMGIYNCESTLSDAIESLISQTYKNWNLVMCDDGSTDNTYQIAEEYSKKYNNIELIKNKTNMGLGYTLNRCLERVDTEYVARMDGDDISLPQRLEKELDFLENNPEYEIVGTNTIYFDENGDWGNGKIIEEPQKSHFIKFTPFCHSSCLVRTYAYKNINGYSTDKKILRVEDYHLWYRMYLEGYKGYNLQEPLYKIRDDKNASLRRKYKYRINEVYVKRLIYKDFHLSIKYIIYILRPLLVGLLPSFIYEKLHRNRLITRND